MVTASCIDQNQPFECPLNESYYKCSLESVKPTGESINTLAKYWDRPIVANAVTMKMYSYPLLPMLVVASSATVTGSPFDEDRPFNCPANEKFYKCSSEVCYKTCNHLELPPPCTLISPSCYEPACECVDGYLRNSNGTCIPSKNCSSVESVSVSSVVKHRAFASSAIGTVPPVDENQRFECPENEKYYKCGFEVN
ncbi:unnamed protein product, partial [Iphiclides podalirius]